nr:MAG TPA: hypothetical protein [Caudoviricetes sp.]
MIIITPPNQTSNLRFTAYGDIIKLKRYEN